MFGKMAREETKRIVVNEAFNRATLYFGDGSRLEFVHTSRKNRWAKASGQDTTADKVCRALSQFRLNAKHLQLFFVDGSHAEYIMNPQGTTSCA
jgi:hypothetical protein